MQDEKQKKKKKNKNEQNLREKYVPIKCTNIRIMGEPERGEKEKIFEDIMASKLYKML